MDDESNSSKHRHHHHHHHHHSHIPNAESSSVQSISSLSTFHDSQSEIGSSFSALPSDSRISLLSTESNLPNYDPSASVINRIFDDADHWHSSLPHSHKGQIGDENGNQKVGYAHVRSTVSDYELPSEPAQVVSETDLINSIGRPFNPNQAKDLPELGEELLSRRVSQIKLKQIKTMMEDKDVEKIEKLTKNISILAIIIGILGSLLFLLVVLTGAMSTPLQFIQHFLDSFHICKAFLIVGAIQPFGVAAYCKYSTINLTHIRGYFLRVPFTIIVPVGLLFSSIVLLSKVVSEGHESLDAYLMDGMANYFRSGHASKKAIELWNGIQTSFGGCGYVSKNDWRPFNRDALPESCCQTHIHETRCTYGREDVYKNGCGDRYKRANICIVLLYFFLTFGITGAELASVIYVKKLHECIRDEIYDERSNKIIIGGRFCSLCDIDNSDDDEPKNATVVVNKRKSSSVKSNATFESLFGLPLMFMRGSKVDAES